ncbi:16S rRNA (adenine(1518)-N(6)/adenine(1519)-N(6))-dimethyltransferase RsmA [Simiduia sp. 21SJ11W-1]|uniref:16S rRNA (adenine(1518)-N(6)/adenine(1519)-N(6))- dimethyltransferase RsmA n=1 Tax=Simiduia sp. 21SJ11W-1 TaxID=2909669 RepID=UPI00209FE906|nr:16S rRNA (adenine(1518)-N(6)/adenine(1519)-N(6))-dimethyltransferase RsmA [Simiduia sp. 21SJ11W-1]UTA48607.1 16S rRNA (adenine(1518)-N(6)/adenine(1519)-N(6))-dimethyltransferase RsmA [Simiduia sp. 21SJ11W-1]
MTDFYHKARKRFGQNFLIDQGIIGRIARAVGARPEEQVVEIGPGKGAITELLIADCPHLKVVELDRDLIPWLKVKFEQYPDFEVIANDALKVDFGALAGNRPLRIVGNLPYNISTPLIFHLLSFVGQVQDMHFMLQKEVVQRMGAEPGSKAYGRLSIMVQYWCRVEYLFDVGPQCFSPAPKVDSAIVRLTPRAEPEVAVHDHKVLQELVTAAFSQRRKTLRNTLKQLMSVEAIEQLDFDTSRRPETISVAEFVGLANHLLALREAGVA